MGHGKQPCCVTRVWEGTWLLHCPSGDGEGALSVLWAYSSRVFAGARGACRHMEQLELAVRSPRLLCRLSSQWVPRVPSCLCSPRKGGP